MKRLVWVLVLSLVTAVSFGQDDDEKLQKLMQDASDAKATLLQENPDLKKFFETSKGYVIFPNVGKGGLIVGGAAGNGILYEKDKAVGHASLKEVNVGFQAGGQAVIEVIFFETEERLENFKKGNFQFAANASAVVLKSGESFDAAYDEGIAVFTHAKAGFMAEASVGGQKFKYDPF